MREFTSILNGDLTWGTYLLCMLAAAGSATLLALAASVKNRLGKSLLMTVILVAPVVTTIVIMVNGSIGTGLAVAGAFTLVRFRSVAGKAKDIVLLFMSMAIGLISSQGYVGVCLVFTLLCGLGFLVLALIPVRSEREMSLRVTVPESLNVLEAFEEIIGQYTVAHHLVSIKTTNMGSLYKLHYNVVLKDGSLTKEFLDKLRTRNGNLEIALSEAEEKIDEM